MVKKIVIMLMCALGMSATAQTYKYSYTYDAAGRRTIRQIVLSSAVASSSTLKSGVDSVTQPTLAGATAVALPEVVVDSLGGVTLHILPNPVLTSLEVQCMGSIPQGQQMQVQLYTLGGSPLLSTALAAQSTTSIDFSSYSAGQYVLRVQLGSTERVWQVVKQ